MEFGYFDWFSLIGFVFAGESSFGRGPDKKKRFSFIKKKQRKILNLFFWFKATPSRLRHFGIEHFGNIHATRNRFSFSFLADLILDFDFERKKNDNKKKFQFIQQRKRNSRSDSIG